MYRVQEPTPEKLPKILLMDKQIPSKKTTDEVC